MARTKEFDPDVALTAAMELFIQRGYEATSMADLVAHLGVSRASLYATYGCKEALYRKALDRYLDNRPIDPAELLSRPGPALPLIRQLLTGYVAEAASGDGGGRCLVVNAAIERMAVDDKVARRVESSWDEIETALTMALNRARGQGEIGTDADPKAQARLLLVLLQGIRVFASSGSADRRLAGTVDQAMSILR